MSENINQISKNICCGIFKDSFFITDEFNEEVEIETIDEAIKLIAGLEKFIKYKVEKEDIK